MASLLLPNIPDDLQQRLQHRAHRSGRSVEQEVVEILDRALPKVPPIELPTPIVPLRPITSEEVVAAIREGRE